jgi:hypothetical protein
MGVNAQTRNESYSQRLRAQVQPSEDHLHNYNIIMVSISNDNIGIDRN